MVTAPMLTVPHILLGVSSCTIRMQSPWSYPVSSSLYLDGQLVKVLGLAEIAKFGTALIPATPSGENLGRAETLPQQGDVTITPLSVARGTQPASNPEY